MSKPLISFDAAGTLIQVKEPVGQTYAQLARRRGVQVNEADLKAAFRSVWGKLPVPEYPEGQCSEDDDKSWWRQLVDEVFHEACGTPLCRSVLDPLFEELYAFYARAEAWAVYDDVRPVLETLKPSHRFCVVSNFDQRLRSILAGHELEEWFEQIILSSEIGVSKPHPRMFVTALRLMDAEAETSWHVGDDNRCDVEGARACGWRTYAVKRPESGLVGLIEKVREK